MKERGFILLAALGVVTLVGLSTASVWFFLHADLRTIGQGRSTLQALYTAEAGLLGAGVSLEPRIDPIPPLRGGEAPGQADLVVFPGPPFGFRLSAWRWVEGTGGGSQWHVVAQAQSVAGAAKSLRGVLVRAPMPYRPASLLLTEGALYLSSTALAASNQGSIVVVGDGRVAPLAGGDVLAAARLARALAEGSFLLRGEGGVATARPIPVDLFLQDIPVGVAQGNYWNFSEFGRAARYLKGGTVHGLQGEGLLVVAEDLKLEGVVDFSGVILVAGALSLATTDCVVRGFVQAGQLHAGSSCTFQGDLAAVRAADALQTLPREALLQAAFPVVGEGS